MHKNMLLRKLSMDNIEYLCRYNTFLNAIKTLPARGAPQHFSRA
jgi:hypothetical protein